MVENEQGPEKKLVVDEDWKARVQAEKQTQQQSDQPDSPQEPPAGAAPRAEEKGPAGQEPTAGQKPPEAKAESSPEQVPIPPASFSVLVTNLATQAMAALGQIPGLKESGPPTAHLELAKHYIDTLQVLQEKTRGNLTKQESAVLDDILYELRMLFINVRDDKTPRRPTGG